MLFGLLPRLLNIWVPPSAALVPLLLAYPIWSWRKLEAAQKFLDFELDYLRHNLITLPLQKTGLGLEGYDRFSARIAQVRAATQQLRFLQNDRKETLAFISHDIRAPIAKALMALKEHQHLSSKLQQPLSQALSLSEDFLHASRAEMMEVSSFNEVDFAGLIHQAVDDVYASAIKKNMGLQRNVVEGVVWVKGNFGLLHRAVLNLISNAVKYGYNNTVVDIFLTLNNDKTQAIFSVTNIGVGISAVEQANIFRRFSRVKGQERMSEGAGLGLYFVKTVAEKHQGLIQVDSDIGQPTIFSLQLPIIDYQAHED
jgi:signal transduction histidine kinase